jgi:tetratricopeptide (TPR) repeat protein
MELDFSELFLRGFTTVPDRSASRRVFISTVSGEFEKPAATFPGLRSKLRGCLARAGCDVKVQEDFRQTAGGTLEKLDAYIRDCDAVIHLVGRLPGYLADADSPQDVPDYLAHIATQPGGRTFLDKQPELLAEFGAGAGISLTQFEAYMALHHRVPLFVYATPDAATGQAEHLNRLKKGRPAKYASPFSDAEDLFLQLVGDLNVIVPGLTVEEPRIAATRIVSRHETDELLGREKQLALLDEAWAGPELTNLLSIIAWGGVGKTALLAYWVSSRFKAKGWRNASGEYDPLAYFDWTFYDQGTRRDDATQAGAASVGSFFQKALEHFGDPEPENPEKKAARLARLIQKQRSLLILDGLEPLQYPVGHPQAGQITDPDLRELLGLLAQRNPGLCLVSSRQALSDFLSGDASPTRQHDLEDLPLECAVSLLRKMQIIGTDEELEQAAKDYSGHALSLIVLGRFLIVKGGDIRIRGQIKLERASENRNQGITRNAWHVLEAYEEWLSSPQGNAADVQALRLTGLFDRPASVDCLDALRRPPAMAGLTDALVGLSDDAWNTVLLRLHDAHLIQLRFPAVEAGSFAPRPEPDQVALDAHPLIREYFAKRLREQQPEAFQEAHSRLFDHLCATTKHRPDGLDGLQPLYQAVVHGCLAGRHPEACDKVYRDRILRGTESDGFYSRDKLGAIGADLGAVAAFFDQQWSRLCPNLGEGDQAWLLNEASVCLRALGRLTEAREPMRVGLEMRVQQRSWANAAISASNLSQLEVTLGLLGDAVGSARRSIELSDQPPAFWGDRRNRRVTAADALHQSGERSEARGLFQEAEAIQRMDQPQFDLLRGLAGFRYCDLILAPAERAAWNVVLSCGEKSRGALTTSERSEMTEPCASGEPTVRFAEGVALAEAERRGNKMLEWRVPGDSLLSIALDHLTLARVAVYRAVLEAAPASAYQNPHLPAALDGLCKAGTVHHTPNALLTAALHEHVLGDDGVARRHLDEAQQIAERGPMPLYLADVHLHRARLFRDRDELAKARLLIDKHGYGRRHEELAAAEAAAAHW